MKRRIPPVLALAMSLGAVVGCAHEAVEAETDEDLPTTTEAADEGASVSENFDPALAAIIMKAKLASIDIGAVTPQFASCGTPGSTATSVRVNDAAFRGAAQQRSGSSTSCPAPGALQPTDDALYFCWTRENTSFTWTYLENLRTHRRGWTRDDLLRGAGAQNHCPGTDIE
jgi:hypothetical protein